MPQRQCACLVRSGDERKRSLVRVQLGWSQGSGRTSSSRMSGRPWSTRLGVFACTTQSSQVKSKASHNTAPLRQVLIQFEIIAGVSRVKGQFSGTNGDPRPSGQALRADLRTN